MHAALNAYKKSHNVNFSRLQVTNKVLFVRPDNRQVLSHVFTTPPIAAQRTLTSVNFNINRWPQTIQGSAVNDKPM